MGHDTGFLVKSSNMNARDPVASEKAYGIASLTKEFFVNEKTLSQYIAEHHIPVEANGNISERHLQTVLAFIEEQDHRINDALHDEAPSFESGDGRIRLLHEDAIRFLRKIPTGSVDIIATDPAYSGMNNKLNLGHGRIVGQYANKGATNGNNRKIRNRSFPDVWRFKRIHRAAYPTQKPVELFQAMIYASTGKDFVVCDPFMGSASSAIAAIRNGCRFIGCDISPKAMDLASKRIVTYLESGKDALQPKSMAVEEKIFWKYNG